MEAFKDVERINKDEKYDQMYIELKCNLTSIDIDNFLELVNLSGQWIIYIYSAVITEDVFTLLKTKIESLNGNNIVLKDSMVESFQFKDQDSKRIITIVEES